MQVLHLGRNNPRNQHRLGGTCWSSSAGKHLGDTELSLGQQSVLGILGDTELSLGQQSVLGILGDTELSLGQQSVLGVLGDTELSLGQQSVLGVLGDTELSLGQQSVLGPRRPRGRWGQQEEHWQQGRERWCPCGQPRRHLWSAVSSSGSSAQRGQGAPGAGPAEAAQPRKGPEHAGARERLRELGLFSLERSPRREGP
ncbi:hypothetical protein DUI87_11928 [Hirundo rustica rustica]|uniref:Uncharacterized protein n=1 Tax=Hirundo rustica rustica TaxID=333673 RepID=A0A3M0KF40_HIRRU|nr:hypothetical protein DUI87_11928 [Hirundo rustica rustica]